MANPVERDLIIALGKVSGEGSFDPVIDAIVDIAIDRALPSTLGNAIGILDTNPIVGRQATAAEADIPGTVPGSPEAEVAEGIRRAIEARPNRESRERDRNLRDRDFHTPSGRDVRNIA